MISTSVIKTVVRGVRDEEDQSRNCMIFGLPEAESESEDLKGLKFQVYHLHRPELTKSFNLILPCQPCIKKCTLMKIIATSYS